MKCCCWCRCACCCFYCCYWSQIPSFYVLVKIGSESAKILLTLSFWWWWCKVIFMSNPAFELGLWQLMNIRGFTLKKIRVNDMKIYSFKILHFLPRGTANYQKCLLHVESFFLTYIMRSHVIAQVENNQSIWKLTNCYSLGFILFFGEVWHFGF